MRGNAESGVGRPMARIARVGFGWMLAMVLVLAVAPAGAAGQRSAARACGSQQPFSVPPIALEDLAGIVPLGNLNPSGHTFPTHHIYWTVKEGCQFEHVPAAVEVVSPGDITITQIVRQTVLTLSPPLVDYWLSFTVCGQIQGYFAHVTTLSPAVLSQFSFNPNHCRTYETGGHRFESCRGEVSISVYAGQSIGTAGGAGEAGVRVNRQLDFGLYNYGQQPTTFANQARADTWGLSYIVCPLDYFQDDVRAQLLPYMGLPCDGDTGRTAEPVCGRVDQDVPGAAQGIWVNADDPDNRSEDGHIALVHDNYDPSVPVFSVGTSVPGVASGRYRFTPAAEGLVNRDFDQVTPDGNTYCYDCYSWWGSADNIEQTILVHMPNEGTLTVGAGPTGGCGSGPWSMDANGYHRYIR